MQIRAEQLAAHLQKNLAPIYIVSGDEPLLLQECCDLIRQRCREQGFSEREVLHADAQFDWQALTASACELSLFGDRKLIELRLPSGKPGSDGAKALSQYAQNPPSDNVLLLIFGKLDSASTRSKWYQTLDRAGASIQVWPIDQRQLPRWIEQRLAARGMQASHEAIQILAERVEGNLLAAMQEIEKLQLSCDSAMLDGETVLAAVADNARYDIFGLLDRSLQGDAAGSLKMLQSLKAEGSADALIVWTLARELRLLCRCAEQIEQGLPVDRVLQTQRVWDKRKPLLKAALKRHHSAELYQLLRLCAQIDQAIKGISRDNSWLLLQQLISALAGKTLRL